jgi:hypothetical protein
MVHSDGADLFLMRAARAIGNVVKTPRLNEAALVVS